MTGFLLLCGVWAALAAFGRTERERLLAVTALWALVLIALALGPDSRLAALAGAEVKGWLVLGGVAGLVLAYRAALVRLRARAKPPASLPKAPEDDDLFSDAELSRYARHILLRDIGGPGQGQLKAARITVVGAGGLGSPVLQYLAAAGVGEITVVDDDTVDLSNLQRQVIFATSDLGQPKALAAARAMTAINPHIRVLPVQDRLTDDTAAALVTGRDLVIDGTDGFEAREVANRACVAAGVPLLSGAITQWEGQVSLYDPARGGPCYACLFPTRPAPGLVPTCAEAGVAAPLPGIIGGIMALEAVKALTGAGDSLRGRLLLWDGLGADMQAVRVKRRADCAVCGSAASGA